MILITKKAQMIPNKIRIGTRRSPLAMWQSKHIEGLLLEKWPQLQIEIVPIVTTGDRITDVPLPKIGDKGLFTREIEERLLLGEIDLAVHSLKDLPTTLPEGLIYAGSPERADVRDAFISTKWKKLADVPEDGTIATGSLRRKAQLASQKPKLHFADLRGNIDTRLRKLDEFGYDGILMAAAALLRLERANLITEYLAPETFIPAVGQGAIGLETASNRQDLQTLLSPIIHNHTILCCRAERAFMRSLEGGCSVPLGAWARIFDEQIHLSAFLGSPDGSRTIRNSLLLSKSNPEDAGIALAKIFLERGARDILESLK
jgi:hydroxymethylbilane synthase